MNGKQQKKLLTQLSRSRESQSYHGPAIYKAHLEYSVPVDNLLLSGTAVPLIPACYLEGILDLALAWDCTNSYVS